jgi:hypothetical protein
MKWKVLCELAIAALLIAGHSYAHPDDDLLLGAGRGVDHVMEGVRDMSQAQADFAKLGFHVSNGGRFPGGVYNAVVRFENYSYLELISLAPDPKQDQEISKFITKHDGAMGLGLNVSSAASTASLLRSRQFDVEGPVPGSIMTSGQTKPPPPQWYTVAPADKPASGKSTIVLPIFFIEYLDEAKRLAKFDPTLTTHSNTSVGIGAVWFAVKDSAARVSDLQKSGFKPVPGEMEIDGLKGQGFKAGTGLIVLLSGNGKGNDADKFLSEYDDDIMALSIEVSDLAKAHEVAKSAANADLPIYRGSLGQSFLLPSSLTHGIRIEMFQKQPK